MNDSAQSPAHAAHVGPCRDLRPEGNRDGTPPDSRHTGEPGRLVEPESPHRLSTVTYPRPRCSHCGHVHLRKYRSVRDQGDGTALAWVRCLNDRCQHRFRLLLE